MIRLKHKLPALSELMQLHFLTCTVEELARAKPQPDAAVFVQADNGWHVAHASRLTDDHRRRLNEAPWEPAIAIPLTTPLSETIPLLQDFDKLLLIDASGMPTGYLDRSCALSAIFAAYEVLGGLLRDHDQDHGRIDLRHR